MDQSWKNAMKTDFAWYAGQITESLELSGMENHLREWQDLRLPKDYPGSEEAFLLQEAVDLMDAILDAVWKKNPDKATELKRKELKTRRLERSARIPFQLG